VPPSRMIRAADAQRLLVDTLRAAYLAQSGAMLISGMTLNPLEVLAVDGDTGQSYRVPVTTQADGGVRFGPPIRAVPGGTPSVAASAPSPAAGRGRPDRDQQRIAAAVARGAIPADRAAYWAAQAAAGRDIAVLDQLAGQAVPAGAGKVAAAVAPEDADYTRLFGASEPAEDDGPEYRAMYGTLEEGQRRADAREVAAKDAIAALGDDQVYDRMFSQVSAAAAPVPVSASKPAGQHSRGEAGTQRYRVRAPRVSLRVPQGSDGPEASAESAKPSWRLIDLYAGARVPSDAHPDDIKRLLHQQNRHGAFIKPW
jgi:hypothetical protein